MDDRQNTMRSSFPRRIWFHLALLVACTAPALRADEILDDFRKAFRSFTERLDRIAAVQTLEASRDPEVVDELAKLVKDKDPEVGRAAIDVLARFTFPAVRTRMITALAEEKDATTIACLAEALGRGSVAEAVPALIVHLGNKDWFVKQRAAEALGRIADPAAVEPLIPLASDRDPGVRTVALDALGILRDRRATDVVCAALAEKTWQVRAAAIGAAAKVRPKEAIPILIDMLESEEGRLQVEVDQALRDITGNQFQQPDEWKRWWASFGKIYEVPPFEQILKQREQRENSVGGYAKAVSKKSRFTEIETPSRAILFIIDVSGSMEDLVIDRASFKDRGYESFEKIEIVKTELIRTIESLEPYVRFNVETFATEVDSWKKHLVPANVVNKRNAVKFVERLKAIGGATSASLASSGLGVDLSGGKTNTYGALMVGLDAAGRGLRDKSYGTDVDTIFFLSDGRPTAGEFIELRDIIEKVSDANRLRKVVLHTIAIGRFEKGFMKELANRNGGVFVDLGD